jgi:hypothetical protein
MDGAESYEEHMWTPTVTYHSEYLAWQTKQHGRTQREMDVEMGAVALVDNLPDRHTFTFILQQ